MGYKDILNEFFLIKKETNPSYSLRAFARDLGIPSSNLSSVLHGKQGLSKSTAQQIAERLHPEESDRALFVDMVLAEDARSKREKIQALKRLSVRRKDESKKSLREDFFKLVSEWHYFAILEMVTMKIFKHDDQWIAKTLDITVDEARKSLGRLIRLGLLKTGNGKYVSTGAQLDTQYDIPSSSIKKHNAQILKKASEALWEQKLSEREFSTLTIAIDPEDISFVKERIRKFKSELDTELMERAQRKGTSKVYCLAIQFFNLLKENSHV